MPRHSSKRKDHQKRKNPIDSFFNKIFGRTKKKRQRPSSSILEREDFDIGHEQNQPNDDLFPERKPTPHEHPDEEKHQLNQSPDITEKADIISADDDQDENITPEDRKTLSRQEYLKIWGIEEEKGFFQKLTDKRKIKKSVVAKPPKKISGGIRKMKRGNPVDSFFNNIFGKVVENQHSVNIPSSKEAREKKKELKKKKQHFLKRMRKHRQQKQKKSNWFTNLFKPKTKDPFLKQEESASIFSEVFKTNKYSFFFFNSLFLFLSAYILVYLLYQFTVLLSASLWKLDSVLYYWDLAFDDYSRRWNKWNIIAITFSGPFISIITGIIFLKVLFNIETLKASMRHLILWIALHGFNRFLGGFIAGVMTDEGFGYVVNWLYIPEFYKILFMILAVFLLGVIGYFSTRQFLDVSGSFHYIRKANRKAYLFSQAVLPSIVGSILLIIIKLPNNPPYETIIVGTFIFLTIPTLFNFRAKPTPVYTAEKLKYKFYYKYFLIFIILILFYRVVLDSGLHFKIDINISISNARYFKF